MIGQDLIQRFERFAPPAIAEDGDPIGLQLGDPRREVKTVMTTLDVRPEVVDEAIAHHVDFIFAHHPMVFHAAKNLDLRDPQNAMYAQLIKHDIIVYGAHTNLDNANGGMNDWLAQQLGLQQTIPLLKGGIDPETGLPYGMGRVGNLSQPMDAMTFAQHCKQAFGVRGLRLIQPAHPRMINRVAVLGGSGGQFYLDALKKGADAYVTGDVSYHVGHDMIAHDLVTVDPGHHIECICKSYLQQIFTQWCTENDWAVDIYASQLNTDPFTFV